METVVEVMTDSRLMKLLQKMDVPYHRTQILNKNNLTWLHKKLPLRNSENPNFSEVMFEVGRRLNEGLYEN